MKMKREHRVPLTDQMLKLLEKLRSVSGGSVYLFPQSNNAEKHMSSQTVNLILKRIGYKGRLVSHGFRAVASTYFYDQGHKPEVIEACLAHVFGNMTVQAYNRSDFFKLRINLMKEWSDYVANKYETVDSIVSRLYPVENSSAERQQSADANNSSRAGADGNDGNIGADCRDNHKADNADAGQTRESAARDMVIESDVAP